MIPVSISFPDLPPSSAVEYVINEKINKLERRFPRITSCRVAVESPHHHHQKGRIFHIQIKAHVPGEELVVSREPAKNMAHADIYVAIRDAFKALTRQLEDYYSKRREHVKIA